jgi:hypothetical protein
MSLQKNKAHEHIKIYLIANDDDLLVDSWFFLWYYGWSAGISY